MKRQFGYTVIVPTYNRHHLLGRAVNSIREQAAPHEILIIDDASSDGTIDASNFQGLPIRIIRHQHNLGAAAARNTGIVNSTSQWLAFLDSDDEWLPGKIEAQFEALARRPKATACLAGYCIDDARYGRIREFVADPLNISMKMLTYGCNLSLGSTLLVRRDVFDEVGLFDPTLRRHEDWDWAIRYTKRHSFIGVPRTLVIVHKKDDPDFSIVQPALDAIRSRYLSYWTGLSRMDGRRFMSSLLLEEAAGRYYSDQYLKAAYLVARSMAIYPFRNRRFFFSLVLAIKNLLSSRDNRKPPPKPSI